MVWSVELKVTNSWTLNMYVLVYTQVLKLTSALKNGEKGAIHYIAGVSPSERGLLSPGNIIHSVEKQSRLY